MIIHALWLHAARGRYGMWVQRVSTDDNIADLPSREDFGVLEDHENIVS